MVYKVPGPSILTKRTLPQVVLLLVVICLDILLEPIASFQVGGWGAPSVVREPPGSETIQSKVWGSQSVEL
jgi:hypothetical protein